MNVGARFVEEEGSPKRAARKTRTSRPAESAPRTTWRAVERSARSSQGANGRPSASRSSCGRFQSVPRRRNESTSTTAAPHEKSHVGTGRSRTPPIPWARIKGEPRGRRAGSPDPRARPRSGRARSALNGSRAGEPGRDVGHQVVAVQVDVIGDVGDDDEDDASRLARSSRAGFRRPGARPRRRSGSSGAAAVAASSWSREGARVVRGAEPWSSAAVVAGAVVAAAVEVVAAVSSPPPEGAGRGRG